MVVQMDLGQITDFPFFKSKLEGFNDYFDNSLRAVVENLAKSGVTETRKAIRAAKTEWGEARMEGVRFGVRFAPYGRTSGREDSGYMYDSVRSRVGRDDNGWRGVWGWSRHSTDRAPYIRYQEFGFESTGKFDPVATAKAGKARFKEGKPKSVPGVFSMFFSRDQVGRRTEAAFSAAWNQARKDFAAAGNKGDAGSYLKARGEALLDRAFNRRF